MMTIQQHYKNQVELLLDVLPVIQEEPRFALKGGTAINLFHRDMPRLSVDIDLTYLPIEPRDVFLSQLTQAMQKLANKLSQQSFNVDMKRSGQHIIKLLVSNPECTIKVEPNTILRGSVFEPEIKELSETAQNTFLHTQKVKAMSMADVYGGKICAALDRQHPRDLFDIQQLFEHEGITDEIRQAFVVYLASGPRPMNELLSPNELDMKEIFEKEFVGMTDTLTTYDALCETRQRLIQTIRSSLMQPEKDFLISLKSGEPQWDLMNLPHLSQMPAIRWKLLNIRKMERDAREQAMKKLTSALS